MHRAFLLFLLVPFLPAQVATPPEAILEGDVVNAVTNAPIAGARLELNGPSGPLYGRADGQGHFVVGNLALSSYYLTVDSPGFLQSSRTLVDLRISRPPAERAVVGSGAASLNSKLPAATVARSTDADGAIHAKATVPLLAYAVISGRVTDPYGVPMANCNIRVLTKLPPRPAGTPAPPGAIPSADGDHVFRYGGISDDKGEYRAARLEPGTYLVVASASRGVMATWQSDFRTTYYPATTDMASAKRLELVAGQQARADIQVVRQPGVRVAGRLVWPDGRAPGAQTYTQEMLLPEPAAQVSDNRVFAMGSDTFALQDVLPGRYTLVAETRERPTDKPVYGFVQPIVVGDKDMDGVDLALQPLRDLAGVVTFREGCTPGPVRILARPLTLMVNGLVETTSGADGKFVLSGLMPGRFSVVVDSPSNPRLRTQASSIKLGERDVMKDGLEAPYGGNEPLRIMVDCAAPGRVP